MRKIALLSFLIILATVYVTVSSETCYDDSVEEYVQCEYGCCGELYDNDRRCCDNTDGNSNLSIIIGGGAGGFVSLILICACLYCFCK